MGEEEVLEHGEPGIEWSDRDPISIYPRQDCRRVDKVLGDGAVKTGAAWKFTTTQPVDDFESYTDNEGTRIYETWTNGWTNNTGSAVGYAQVPFAEQKIVHDSLQSMPLDYNNFTTPFCSEAHQESDSTQDWPAWSKDMVEAHR
jgi:hypothetical protein